LSSQDHPPGRKSTDRHARRRGLPKVPFLLSRLPPPYAVQPSSQSPQPKEVLLHDRGLCRRIRHFALSCGHSLPGLHIRNHRTLEGQRHVLRLQSGKGCQLQRYWKGYQAYICGRSLSCSKLSFDRALQSRHWIVAVSPGARVVPVVRINSTRRVIFLYLLACGVMKRGLFLRNYSPWRLTYCPSSVTTIRLVTTERWPHGKCVELFFSNLTN